MGDLTPNANLLSVDVAGTVTWNGVPVSQEELLDILEASLTYSPQPALAFEPQANAAYGDVANLLALVSKAGLIDRCFRFTDTARFADFANPIPHDEPVPAQKMDCVPIYGY